TQAYGLTETSPFITICESRPEHEKLLCAERSVIKACQGVELLTSGELRVVDEEGHDIPQNGEAIGEIIVRGNAVMKGYYKDAENSHRQGPEICPSRQACDFETVTGLTTQAQRPGPRDAWIATRARWPGSLQRMVRRCG